MHTQIYPRIFHFDRAETRVELGDGLGSHGFSWVFFVMFNGLMLELHACNSESMDTSVEEGGQCAVAASRGWASTLGALLGNFLCVLAAKLDRFSAKAPAL